MRVLITGGGTGGHIYPALTIAEAVKRQRPDSEILFVGGRRGLETDIIPQAGYRLEAITVTYFRRQLSLDTLKTFFIAARAVFQALRIIRRFRPQVVIGTGGYVAGPVVLAAWLLRLPTIIQEQNAFPGATNRLLARLVDRVALGYREAERYLAVDGKCVYTGNPIRAEILTASREKGAKKLGLDPGKQTVIVFGASQGARSINKAMADAAPNLARRKDLQILHATGKKAFGETLKLYGISRPNENSSRVQYGNVLIVPYIYNMPDALAAADLVVGRAGAISSAEIAARGLPAVLVPYPFAAENHQEKNARVFEEAGAARVILDSELDGETLSRTILELLQDKRRLAAMGTASKKLGKPDAAEKIAALIFELVNK